LLNLLAHSSPSFLDGTYPNKTLVAAGRVEGFQEAVAAIVRLTYERPEEPGPRREEYPPLYDDKAWEHLDGQNKPGTS
jgi:hypothetical protein